MDGQITLISSNSTVRHHRRYVVSYMVQQYVTHYELSKIYLPRICSRLDGSMTFYYVGDITPDPLLRFNIHADASTLVAAAASSKENVLCRYSAIHI